MKWRDLQLDKTINKTNGKLTLWQTEKGMLTIDKNTLATSVKLEDREKGYVFHGQGILLLDAIIETDEGALGKSIERELNEPFLMLGNTEETQKLLTEANEEDLLNFGYKNPKEFSATVEELLKKLTTGRMHGHYENENAGKIFALQNIDGKLDFLLAKGTKTVYAAIDVAFVSNGSKEVLKSRNETVVSHHGKTVFIRNGKCARASQRWKPARSHNL